MAKSKSKSASSSQSTLKNPSNSHTVLSILIAVIAILVAILFFGANECSKCLKLLQNQGPASVKPNRTQKIFRSYAVGDRDYMLTEVYTVLYRLGYEKGTNTSDWDLMWTFHWPFEVFSEEMMKIKPHQKVNHIPGTGVISTKVLLATSGLDYIPPAFRLPEDKDKLLEYSKNNPDTNFVLKDNYHRKIKIAKINEIDLNQDSNFIQEFVDKPLLVDGYKFDIGLYTVITSIDPLRIYVYNGDIMLRFCPEKYYPFNPENLDTYVIGDDYFPVWKVPGLDYYYNKLGFSKKEALNAYLAARGVNTDSIYKQAEEAIWKYIVAKESDIIESLKKYPSKRNFFEMVRFDFVVNENIKVHMLEANMSPNLSAAKYEVNKLLYYQILYNLFGLVGVGDMRNRTSLATRSKSEEEMMVAYKNLATFPSICNSELCQTSCSAALECQLCKPCLIEETREFLLESVREHNHRGDFKRIFPPPMTQKEALNGSVLRYSPTNQLQYRWFQGKCLMDSTWC